MRPLGRSLPVEVRRAALLAAIVLSFVTPRSATADVGSELFVSWAPDETMSTTEAFTGVRTAYVLYGSWSYLGAFEFGLAGTLEVQAVRPGPGFALSGTLQSPRLTADGSPCPDGTHGLLVAEIDVLDVGGTGGTLCFEPSVSNGFLCLSQGCDAPEFGWTNFHGWGGASSGAFPVCSDNQPVPNCAPAAVEGLSWGRVKASYR